MNKRLQIGLTDLNDVRGALGFNNELVIINIKQNKQEDKGKDQWVQIDAFSVLLILEGAMEITINSQNHRVQTKAFVDIFDFQAVRNVRVSPDFKGYHIVLARSFMDEVMRNIKRIPISSFLSRYNNPVMELDQTEAELLERFILNMIGNIHRTDHLYQRDMVKNEVRNFFAEILNIITHRNIPLDADIYKNKEEIITQFIHLVNRYCKEEHSVGFYAQKLCIESKYLSRVLKAISGKTANQFIDESIITEAKILLKEPELTIVEITDLLHFSDQSSFGKFFKKHCGLSPLNYRRKLY